MPSAALASHNRALDQFLTSLTRRIVVHRLRVSLPIILAPRPQPTLRQRRRLKRAVLREFRKRCGVRS
jgi:type II secretory pathway predicted ATPase ExeA